MPQKGIREVGRGDAWPLLGGEPEDWPTLGPTWPGAELASPPLQPQVDWAASVSPLGPEKSKAQLPGQGSLGSQGEQGLPQEAPASGPGGLSRSG